MKSVIIVEKAINEEEYLYPYFRLLEEGIQVEIALQDPVLKVSIKSGIPIHSAISTRDLNADDFDSVIIVASSQSSDSLCQDNHILNFLKAMNKKKKVIAAIYYGTEVLITAQLCQNKKMACYIAIKDALKQGGAIYVDEAFALDENIVTSPNYCNNADFMRETIALMHRRQAFVDYSDIVVTKPWGYEYLVTQNLHVGLWYLFLKPGQETSLHSHPNKKTGLIVLNGEAEISFLNGKHILNPGDKIMIRNGVFHATKNIGNTPLELLEVESPNNKLDIIRLEDAYGRSGTPYEDSEYYNPKKEKWDLIHGHQVGGCLLKEYTFSVREELINIPDCKIIVLSGKLKSNEYDVLTEGNVVDNVVMSRLATKFESVLPIDAILVTKL